MRTPVDVKIAVCDDDPDIRNKLVTWLRAVDLPEHCLVSLTEYSSGTALVNEYRSGTRYNLIFLDIIMDGLDGIQTARLIREEDENALIIFLTSSPDYAVQSYRVDAFDYLLKTADREQMEPVFLKALSAIADREERRLVIRNGAAFHSVHCNEIEYIEIYAKKITFYLIPEQKVETYKAFRELEAELSDLPQFFKIHRSVIVNMMHIARINSKFVATVSGQRLPIARGKYPALEQAFLAYTARRI
jgi:DNA-binding LytR/AlgR family response regulator